MSGSDFARASDLFDRYVDWERRLAREVPFLEQVLKAAGATRVADVACGTGQHAVALAEQGFQLTGFDPDQALLGQARRRSEERGVVIEWVEASFLTLAETNRADFDALLCLGNSLSLAAPRDLPAVLENMAALLTGTGIAILHSLNYPMLACRGSEVWGPVRKLEDGTSLLKGFIPRGDDPWDVLFVALTPAEGKEEKPRSCRFQLYPHAQASVAAAARQAGLNLANLHGGFQGEEPADAASADLVYVFTRRG
jgi:SAM-dependent methyltransferase